MPAICVVIDAKIEFDFLENVVKTRTILSLRHFKTGDYTPRIALASRFIDF